MAPPGKSYAEAPGEKLQLEHDIAASFGNCYDYRNNGGDGGPPPDEGGGSYRPHARSYRKLTRFFFTDVKGNVRDLDEVPHSTNRLYAYGQLMRPSGAESMVRANAHAPDRLHVRLLVRRWSISRARPDRSPGWQPNSPERSRQFAEDASRRCSGSEDGDDADYPNISENDVSAAAAAAAAADVAAASRAYSHNGSHSGSVNGSVSGSINGSLNGSFLDDDGEDGRGGERGGDGAGSHERAGSSSSSSSSQDIGLWVETAPGRAPRPAAGGGGFAQPQQPGWWYRLVEPAHHQYQERFRRTRQKAEHMLAAAHGHVDAAGGGSSSGGAGGRQWCRGGDGGEDGGGYGYGDNDTCSCDAARGSAGSDLEENGSEADAESMGGDSLSIASVDSRSESGGGCGDGGDGDGTDVEVQSTTSAASFTSVSSCGTCGRAGRRSSGSRGDGGGSSGGGGSGSGGGGGGGGGGASSTGEGQGRRRPPEPDARTLQAIAEMRVFASGADGSGGVPLGRTDEFFRRFLRRDTHVAARAAAVETLGGSSTATMAHIVQCGGFLVLHAWLRDAWARLRVHKQPRRGVPDWDNVGGLPYLEKTLWLMSRLPLTMGLLRSTEVGRLVKKLRRLGERHKTEGLLAAARSLYAHLRDIVVANMKRQGFYGFDYDSGSSRSEYGVWGRRRGGGGMRRSGGSTGGSYSGSYSDGLDQISGAGGGHGSQDEDGIDVSVHRSHAWQARTSGGGNRGRLGHPGGDGGATPPSLPHGHGGHGTASPSSSSCGPMEVRWQWSQQPAGNGPGNGNGGNRSISGAGSSSNATGSIPGGIVLERDSDQESACSFPRSPLDFPGNGNRSDGRNGSNGNNAGSTGSRSPSPAASEEWARRAPTQRCPTPYDQNRGAADQNQNLRSRSGWPLTYAGAMAEGFAPDAAGDGGHAGLNNAAAASASAAAASARHPAMRGGGHRQGVGRRIPQMNVVF